MEQVKIFEIKEDVVSRNNLGAKAIREDMKEKKIFYLNVMSSAGSGKTTLLLNLINRLKNDYKIGVIEADLDSAVDADDIHRATGVKTIQIHTGGACHMTCQMSKEALDCLETDGLDVVILENIGNLVCPAEFDTGATANLVLLSVPEGDDKPLKYPLMFEVATFVAVTKTDVLPVFDFSFDRFKENVKKRNPNARVFFTSSIKDEGLDELEAYLREKIAEVKNN